MSDLPGSQIRDAVNLVAGHATLFRQKGFRKDQAAKEPESENQIYEDRFHPLPAQLALLHKKLRHAFDPKMILNRNVMYKDANVA